MSDPSPKSRHLSPDELASEIARRLKPSEGAHRKPRRPRFDMVNAGRLIMGLGGLLLIVGLIGLISWISGLGGYQAEGTVLVTSPAYSCPGGPVLGEVFEGETVTVIGKLGAEWLVLHDERAPHESSYVAATAVSIDGDPTQLSDRGCDPTEPLPVASGEQTTTGPGDQTTAAPGDPIAVGTETTSAGVDTTTAGGGNPSGGNPGTTGSNQTTSTTRVGTVPTTSTPFPTAPPPSTTTTTRPPTTTTTSGGTTTTIGTTTTTDPPTTTTSTDQPTTTTTEPETTTTEPPTTTIP